MRLSWKVPHDGRMVISGWCILACISDARSSVEVLYDGWQTSKQPDPAIARIKVG